MTAVAEQPTKKAKKKAEDDAMSSVEEMASPAEDPKMAAPPVPVPGDADFDWEGEYPGEKVFTYTTPKDQVTTKGQPCGGLVIGMAAISEKRQPDFEFMRVTRRKPEFEQVIDMIEFVASDAALDLLAGWSAEDIMIMWNTWTEWNKTNAGK